MLEIQRCRCREIETVKTIYKEEKLKNLYKPDEIDTIFRKCESVDDILEVCAIFKEMREEGYMSDDMSKMIAQFALLRFQEITAKM